MGSDHRPGRVSRLNELGPGEIAAILDAMPAAVCIYDADDRIVFWNERYLDLFPWHRDAMYVGRPYREALREFFRQNLSAEELPHLEHHLDAGVERHANLREPFVFQTKLGVWLTVAPLRLPCGRCVKVWNEITPRFADAGEYRDLLDSITAINIGFAMFDRDGRYVFSNHRLSELLPRAVHLFTAGRRYRDLVHGCAEAAIVPEYSQDLLAGADRPFPLSAAGQPVVVFTWDARHLQYEECRTAEGGLITVWTDVSARAESETRLRKSEAAARAAERKLTDLNNRLEALVEERTADLVAALDRAEASDAAKSRLLANVSHELRTPLNAILGFAEIMASGVIDVIRNDRYRDYAGDIQSSARYLMTLIDDLLYMARLDADDLMEDVGPVALPALFDRCKAMLVGQAAAKQVVLRFETDPGLPQAMAPDRALMQILLNVAGNALKFTEAGGLVRVSAAMAPGAPGAVAIAVRDSGIGIPASEIESLREPFSRSQWSRGHPGRGTGLGLPIAIRLAEAMGGALTIDSVEGEGTTVTVTVPTAQS